MRLTDTQRQRYEQAIALKNAIEKVPLELQPLQLHCYPSDNTHEFERWFKDNTTAAELVGKERTYLPIMWTGYWCNNGYGKKERKNNLAQRFVDALKRNKKYFTICQYDDGPMVDFKDLDIKVFGMSGGRIDYPIPLLCCPHKFEFPNVKKDIFCSFIGSDTHPIRRELVKEFKGKPDCLVEIKKMPLKDYCEVLARSVFALCPRGYGLSSFRIAEGLQYDCVPVYISNQFVTAYNESHIVQIRDVGNGISGLHETLKRMDGPLLRKSTEVYKKLYTYAGCKQKILENI